MPTAHVARPRRKPGLVLRQRHPSILHSSLHEDPWIQRCTGENCLVLYLQALPISILSALPFDLVTLNHRLFELRRRCPRRS